jgi:hypothetical protein
MPPLATLDAVRHAILITGDRAVDDPAGAAASSSRAFAETLEE